MRSMFFSIALGLAALAFALPVRAESVEKRIALVIGEASYPARSLAATANDAGLIAQTLQAAGFDVVGARDLDEDALRHAFRDFVEKARTSGPDTVAFVYLAGYGVQLEGENYLVPVDADIGPQSDAPSRSVRISDLLRPLAALPLKLSIAVLDAARAGPFSLSGQPLAGGLALVEPGAKNMLLAFNAAPGTVAPEEKGPYGRYAQALAEMIREGGLPLGDLFDRVRLRVAETTKGAQTPWNSTRIDSPFVFFVRSAQAPAPATPLEQTSSIASRPIRELGARDAYLAALERDTLPAYEEFLAAYPGDPLAKRIRAMVAARREAIIWRRTRNADTSAAYWTYLRRYPRGPHCGDARRRLTAIAASLEPPPSFALVDYYDAPPPPPEEIVFVERPILVFDDPYFDFAPPPLVPVYFLPPPPPEFVVLPPPQVIGEPYVLPVPAFTPVPAWVAPPPYVAPPPNNFFFTNVHNTVIVDRSTNVVTVKDPGGHILSNTPLKAAAAAAGAAAIAAALPPVLAKKAALHPQPGMRPGPAALGQQPAARPAHALPPAAPGPLPGRPAPPSGGALLPPGTGAPPQQGRALPRAMGAPKPSSAGQNNVLGIGALPRGPAPRRLQPPVHGQAQRGEAAFPGGVALPARPGRGAGAAVAGAARRAHPGASGRMPFFPMGRPGFNAPQRANLPPAYRPRPPAVRTAPPFAHLAPPHIPGPAPVFGRRPPAAFHPSPPPQPAMRAAAQPPRPAPGHAPRPHKAWPH